MQMHIKGKTQAQSRSEGTQSRQKQTVNKATANLRGAQAVVVQSAANQRAGAVAHYGARKELRDRSNVSEFSGVATLKNISSNERCRRCLR